MFYFACRDVSLNFLFCSTFCCTRRDVSLAVTFRSTFRLLRHNISFLSTFRSPQDFVSLPSGPSREGAAVKKALVFLERLLGRRLVAHLLPEKVRTRRRRATECWSCCIPTYKYRLSNKITPVRKIRSGGREPEG